MQEIKQPSKKPLIFYYIVTLLIVMVLNMTLFPTVLQQRVQDVTYDQFMSMTYDKNVGQVEIEGDEITFTDKDNQNIYRTTKTDDPDLTQRLYDSGAVFQEIDTQPGMLTSLLVGWVLPLLPFLLIGYFLNRRMKKAMGGADGMMFGMGGGGSGAKMYVPSSTGIRFADVAGEDEAKELLGEIVDFLHDPDKYRAIGATLPKGALLVGPPGTGKTLLAKAVAGEANVPFFSIPSPAASLWRCSWAGGRPRSGTCSSRPTRRPPASSSSTRSTPSARSGTASSPGATTSGSRP